MPFLLNVRKVSTFCNLYFLPLCSVALGAILYSIFYLGLSSQVYWKFLSLDSVFKSADIFHQAKSNQVQTLVSESKNLYSVSVEVLNVRQEPNMQSQIVKKISQLERIAVWEIRDGWARIDSGWVMLKFLKEEK